MTTRSLLTFVHPLFQFLECWFFDLNILAFYLQVKKVSQFLEFPFFFGICPSRSMKYPTVQICSHDRWVLPIISYSSFLIPIDEFRLKCVVRMYLLCVPYRKSLGFFVIFPLHHVSSNINSSVVTNVCLWFPFPVYASQTFVQKRHHIW